MSLTLILPLYNEADRFSQSFRICQKLIKNHPNWEIIFVNDGSSDNTSKIVLEKIKDYRQMILLSYSQNQGKGFAIKKGVAKASKKLILFSDIDFSTPISELDLFLPFMQKNADIVIGTRKVKGATITKRQKSLRESLGKGFTFISNFILGLGFSDHTCGFKLFKKEVAKKLFAKIRIKGWGFDGEILFLASKYKYKVVEVPVVWQNDERSKVNLGTDIYRSFSDLIKIRLNNWQKKY